MWGGGCENPGPCLMMSWTDSRRGACIKDGDPMGGGETLDRKSQGQDANEKDARPLSLSMSPVGLVFPVLSWAVRWRWYSIHGAS